MARIEVRFFWRGGRFSVPAQQVGEELERAFGRRKATGIQPEEIVERARRKDSPLHGCFEWDDSEAARLYRITQAREVVRSLGIVIERDGETTEEIHAYVHLEDGQGYRPLRAVCADRELRARAIELAVGDIKQARGRLRELEDSERVLRTLERAEHQALELVEA